MQGGHETNSGHQPYCFNSAFEHLGLLGQALQGVLFKPHPSLPPPIYVAT